MMMVHRTGGDKGNLEIDIRLKGYGRFRCSAGTMKAPLLNKRKALARLLAEKGQHDLLRGLDSGSIAWSTVEMAQRQDRLTDPALSQDVKLARTLKAAVDDTVPKMGKAATRTRYALALDHAIALVERGEKGRMPIVRDLLRDDWHELLRSWDVAVATKNGVRRGVSRFLTRYLGDKYHPFRRAVLHEDRWAKLKEPRRMRGFAAEHFWPLMARVPEHCVPSYVLLAATGMRVGEYLNDGALQLDDVNRQLIVDGKTGPKVYAIAPGVWSYVKAAVPCRVARVRGGSTHAEAKTISAATNRPGSIGGARAADATRRPLQHDARYKKLYKRLKAAGDAIGVTATIHDLRRLFVRLGVAAVGETATQTAVGHETATMTRDYARWHTQAQVADAVAAALGLTKPEKPRRKRGAR